MIECLATNLHIGLYAKFVRSQVVRALRDNDEVTGIHRLKFFADHYASPLKLPISKPDVVAYQRIIDCHKHVASGGTTAEIGKQTKLSLKFGFFCAQTLDIGLLLSGV